MFPKILEKFPDSTLHVFCDLEHQWTNLHYPDDLTEIKKLIQQPGVTLYGWVSKSELMEFWSKMEYFLYPCCFEETFCLTAMEAAASRTLVITNGLAGLYETAQYGVVVPGNPKTSEWQERCLSSVFEIMENDNSY